MLKKCNIICVLCKIHIIFEFSTSIFVIAMSKFCLLIFKIRALVFVQNKLNFKEKFSCKSLVKT